ncbi:integral membrane protein S linking to the trans Golgi network-domain-containing protein [Sporodiniella umbellata]|nr:integral membrane protein S linking to the trans Golgi network-domain-containing protein [Sporodiniella umbellata]
MAASSFRSSRWDPILIISQMTALQSVLYLTLSILFCIGTTLTGAENSLDLIFSFSEIRADTGFGWTILIVWMVNALIAIPLLMLIVQRARQILDFVLTFHFFHLIFVWINDKQFPWSLSWWVLQLVNILVMTFGGEWACMHREMKPIMIHSNLRKPETTNNGSSSSNNPTEEEDIDGLSTKKKRKVSDAHTEEAPEQEDKGSLLSVVGKAKKVLSLNNPSSRNNNRYDMIPMDDIEAHNRV